jgi:hypothetical protein
MRRAERREAEHTGKTPRTLREIDYLLRVIDEARLGALRFSQKPGGPFLAADEVTPIPPLVELPRLLSAAEHVVDDSDSNEDLRLLLAPGSSLGGARPREAKLLGVRGCTPATRGGWRLSPAYDLNPVPVDIKPRVLATAIDLDDGTASLDLALDVADYFELNGVEARRIAGEVGKAVGGWREAARNLGLASSQIDRVASAFDHDDLHRARAL